jgi:hypothetical protein
VSPLNHDDLPLADYDHLPLESLRQRIRTLDAKGLEALLDYEQAHGSRLPVVQAMERRLEQLRDGAQPSGGDPGGLAPELAGRPDAPAQTDGATDAPPINPPSQGVPTNPAQPR